MADEFDNINHKSYRILMTAQHIYGRYHVSPQIDIADVDDLKKAGFTTIICNRPDFEVPLELQSKVIKVAVEAAGMRFEVLPLSSHSMDRNAIAHQFELVEQSQGPVLAYCASGTRCTIIWALSQAGLRDAEEILSLTAQAGYPLDGLRPYLTKSS